MATAAGSTGSSSRKKGSKRSGAAAFDDETAIRSSKQRLNEMGEIQSSSKRRKGTLMESNIKIEPSTKMSNNVGNAESEAELEWTTDELLKLIDNIQNVLPKVDNIKYSTQAKKIDWDKVKFDHHSGDDCKRKWEGIGSKLRRFRTLTEMVSDAKEWAKHPWLSFKKAKSKSQHPEMPKKPLTPYFRYFLEKQSKYSQEHPDMSMTDLAKLLAKKFGELPDKKKQKYKESYEKENEVYKIQIDKFRKEHPDVYRETVHHSTKSSVKTMGPQKPQSPTQLFLADKMKKHSGLDNASKKELEEKYKAQWKNLADSKKIRYIKKSVEDERRYNDDFKQYCLDNPDCKMGDKKSVINKSEKEIKDRYDGKPDKPPNSGYSLYSKIMLKELKDIPSKEKMSEISKRWKELTEKERQSYNTQAQLAVQKYQKEFDQYLSSLPEEERQKLEESKKKKPTTSSNQKSSSTTAAVAAVTSSSPMENTNNKQKKPLNALFFYQQEKLPSFKVKHPDKSEQEITRLIIREYNVLPDKKREKYKQMAEVAKKQHEENKPKPVKSKAAPKKIFKGEPKKPPQSGYLMYTTEIIAKLNNVEPKQRMMEISKRWKAISNQEREKYKKKATDAMKKYNKELTKFISGLSEEDRKLYEQAKAAKKKGSTAASLNSKKGKAVVLKKEKSSDEEDSDKESSNSDTESGSSSGSEKSDSSDSGSDSDSGSSNGNESNDSDSDDSKDSTGSSSGDSGSGSDSRESGSDSDSGSGSEEE